MSTSPSNLDNGANSNGFNTASGVPDPMTDLNVMKNWAPRAMAALRQSNMKNQMVNPVTPDVNPPPSGIAKGLLSGLL